MKSKAWGSLFSADAVLMCCLFYAYGMTIKHNEREIKIIHEIRQC